MKKKINVATTMPEKKPSNFANWLKYMEKKNKCVVSVYCSNFKEAFVI